MKGKKKGATLRKASLKTSKKSPKVCAVTIAKVGFAEHERGNLPQIDSIGKYLLDDEGSPWAGDDVHEVEIAVADFLDGEALQLFSQLDAEGGSGLDVLHQGLLVERPEPIRRRRRHNFHGEETGRKRRKP